jgi:hypothetical protein
MYDKEKEHADAFKDVLVELYKFKGEPRVSVSRTEYETFCKEYVFQKLKNETFGSAFCKRFNIEDRAISNLVGESFTRDLIETLGYIK